MTGEMITGVKSRRAISLRKLLRRISARQGHRCFYCSCLTFLPGHERVTDLCRRFGINHGLRDWERRLKFRRATREHLIRRADGGTNEPGNIVMACAWCNHVRGDRTPDEHKRLMMCAMIRGDHPNAYKKKEPEPWDESQTTRSSELRSGSPSPPSSTNASS